MKVQTQEVVIVCDVDDTLVMWGKAKKGEKVIHVTCPYSHKQETLRPHKGHIKVLKDRHARGSLIIVWSAAGNQWANAVVKALGLEPYVDLILSKPTMYIDDKKAKEVLGTRLYIPYKDNYGG